MTRSNLKYATFAIAAATAASLLELPLAGYTAIGHKWATNEVMYFVNPQNLSVPASNALTAIQDGASAWSDQTRANVRLVYGGTTSGSALTLNFKNEVFFRNEAGPGGLTYWYTDGAGNLIDADA